jgi:hypothetical protein
MAMRVITSSAVWPAAPVAAGATYAGNEGSDVRVLGGGHDLLHWLAVDLTQLDARHACELWCRAEDLLAYVQARDGGVE